jgi:CheY-like chemotaxis protein
MGMPKDAPRLRLLVVDDEPAIANTLAHILRHQGFETHIAYSGEQAIEVANAVSPDVLISDLSMGALSGFDAAIRIREELPDCRIILFSGHFTTEEILQRSAQAELNNFELLQKPLHPQRLLDLLSKIGHWAAD